MNLLNRKFKYHTDNAHGWVEVTKKLLERLGIDDKITSYSFINENKVFLEEDGDLTVFIDRYEEITGKSPEFIRGVHQDNHIIRHYESYKIKT